MRAVVAKPNLSGVGSPVDHLNPLGSGPDFSGLVRPEQLPTRGPSVVGTAQRSRMDVAAEIRPTHDTADSEQPFLIWLIEPAPLG